MTSARIFLLISLFFFDYHFERDFVHTRLFYGHRKEKSQEPDLTLLVQMVNRKNIIKDVLITGYPLITQVFVVDHIL